MAGRSPRSMLASGTQLRHLMSHCWLFSWFTRAESTAGWDRTITAVRAFRSASRISAFFMSTASSASPWMIQEPANQRDSPTRTSATCTRVDTRYCSRSSWTMVGPIERTAGGVSRSPKSQLRRIGCSWRTSSPRAPSARIATKAGSQNRIPDDLGLSCFDIADLPLRCLLVREMIGVLAVSPHAPPRDLLVAAGDRSDESNQGGQEYPPVLATNDFQLIEHGSSQ